MEEKNQRKKEFVSTETEKIKREKKNLKNFKNCLQHPNIFSEIHFFIIQPKKIRSRRKNKESK